MFFSGIGGFRRGCDLAGGICAWSCEKDKFARQSYVRNFDVDYHEFAEDIKDVDPKGIPEHDLLLAGFPCQPFSMAGRCEGFAHETQGTLFFELAKIISTHVNTCHSRCHADVALLRVITRVPSCTLRTGEQQCARGIHFGRIRRA